MYSVFVKKKKSLRKPLSIVKIVLRWVAWKNGWLFFMLFYVLLLPIVLQHDTFAVTEYNKLWKNYKNVA